MLYMRDPSNETEEELRNSRLASEIEKINENADINGLSKRSSKRSVAPDALKSGEKTPSLRKIRRAYISKSEERQKNSVRQELFKKYLHDRIKQIKAAKARKLKASKSPSVVSGARSRTMSTRTYIEGSKSPDIVSPTRTRAFTARIFLDEVRSNGCMKVPLSINAIMDENYHPRKGSGGKLLTESPRKVSTG